MSDSLLDPIGGGASPDIVAETAREDLSVLPGASAGDPLAFTTAVIDYLLQRDASGASTPLSAPVVFLFSDYPGRDGTQLGCQRRRGFRIDVQHDISGRVYIAGSSLNDVYECRESKTDLNDLLSLIEQLAQEKALAVIVQVGGKQIVLCEHGTGDEATYAPITVKAVTVSPPAIDEFLTDFHQEYLEKPRDFAPMWHGDPKHRVPVENAEKAIERLLYPIARLIFQKTHLVRRQDEAPSGRADISVTPRPDRSSSGSCVLELKVLRSKHHNIDPEKASSCPPRVNEDAVIDGLNQANEYRRDLGTQFTFLCCYDFRADETDALLKKYEKDATDIDVFLRRYYLYGSAKAFRSAQPDAVKPHDK